MTVNPSELTVMSMARILAIINRTLKVVYENRYLTARTLIVSAFSGGDHTQKPSCIKVELVNTNH